MSTRRWLVALAAVTAVLVLAVVYCKPAQREETHEVLVCSAAEGKTYDIPGGSCTLYPDAPTGRLSCALVQQKGRYPEQGKRVNKRCTEAIFVIDGELILTLSDRTVTLKKNDVVYVTPGQPYAIEGTATVFVFIEPKWDKTQNVPAED